MSQPGLYEETHFPWEEEVTAEIVSYMKTQMDKDYALGSTPRDFHSKGHSWTKATFAVESDIRPDFKVGLFAEPRTYEAWVRYSNASNGRKADDQKDARGMAVKLFGVEGPKLLEDGSDPSALDLLMFTPPIFLTGDTKQFLGFAKASFTSQLRLILFTLFNPRVGLTVAKNFKVIASLLEQTYFSATPYRLGDIAVKYIAVPHVTGRASIPKKPAPNFLLQNLQETLAKREVVFDFKVQPQTDPRKEKIEDGFSEWKSPSYKVATIRLPIQRVTTQELIDLAENSSYNPWRTLAEHRPMGNINRARKVIYAEIAKYRHLRNKTQGVYPLPSTVKEEGAEPPEHD